jgi:hypothetical protein
MKVSVVACGDSAKEWFNTPVDFSVGVNDCFKWGVNTDYLVCVNSPYKFHPTAENGNTDRLQTILNSRPKKFFTHTSNWKQYMRGKAEVEMLSMRNFNGTFKKDRVYFSATSPFVAITLAAKLGATDIILWGIDMINHPRFNPGNSNVYNDELNMYLWLFGEMEREGVKIWLGNEGSCFKGKLKVWK